MRCKASGVTSTTLPFLLLALVATGCAGLTACAKYPAGKPLRYNSGRAAPLAIYAPKVEEWRAVGYSLDWIGYPFPSVDNKDAVTDLVASPAGVIVQERGSVVSLLETNTGQLRWTNQIANNLTRFVGIAIDHNAQAGTTAANTIVVASESEVFTLAASTGSIMTRERLARVANTRPVMLGNQIVYGSAAGEVVAHRLVVALKSWGFLGVGTITADPVQMGETVGFVSQQGDVMFLDTFEGRLVGRARIFGDLQSNPVTDGETLYLASLDQSVWAIAPSGEIRWRYRTPSPLRAQPTILADAPGGATLYINVPGDGMTALDAQTGKVRWNNTNVGGTVLGLRKGKLVVWEQGTLTLLDPAKGAFVTKIDAPNIAKLTMDNPIDGNLYGITSSNLVVKFSSR